MSNDLRAQIYNNLNLKETGELVEIWQKNDHVVWEEITFDLLREILLERLGELPPQDEPIYEYEEYLEDESVEDEDIDEPEAAENEPAFYNPQHVMWLETWLNRVAIAVVVAAAISGLFNLSSEHAWIASYVTNNWVWNLIAWPIAVVVAASGAFIGSVVSFCILKSIATVLKILMAMEVHSRTVETQELAGH